MNTLAALLLLTYGGEIGWVNSPVRLCLYVEAERPAKVYRLATPRAVQCPAEVEIHEFTPNEMPQPHKESDTSA